MRHYREVGGIDYLVKLTRFSSSIKQAIDYAKIVREMYVKRELILISEDVMLEAKDDNLTELPDKIIESRAIIVSAC